MFKTRMWATPLVVTLFVAGALSACGGSDTKNTVYPELDEKSRIAVLAAQDRQKAMGVQIDQLKTGDNAQDFCFEMCNRGNESCSLSTELCQYSTKFPQAVALVATCRFSREQCRRHKNKVPRQCNCIWDEGS